MATASLYRRVLPSPPAVDFASSEGKQLFVEAIQSGTMEGFYKLISYFQTQSEPAYCGLASLAMVLNALAIDPGRKWKGPWRWFDESMLDCCEPLEKVKDNGISFGKVVCLAHCAGAKVEAFRTNQSTLDDFRKYVTACSSSDDCHVISSYHRGTLKQTGSGHFSPIGGYHAEKDMALILDVARFKYPPHWVPLSLLWEAMNTVDDATGLHRGFMLISRLHRSPAHLYTLSCKNDNWLNIANYLMDDVPLLLRSEGLKDVKNVFSIVFMSLPSNFTELIKWVAEVRRSEDSGQNLNQEEQERLALKEGVLTLVRETALYKHVMDFFLLDSLCCLTIPTMSSEDNLPDMAESICCLGAGALTGKSGSFERFYCRETCIKHLKANGNKSITVVSGTVVSNNGEQGVDVLVPSSSAKSTCSGSGLSNCINTHPNSSDVFTALLLALSPNTWAGIKDDELKREINCLVSTKNLPTLLQDEILHLRVQLHLLKRCKDNKVTRQEALGVSRVHLHSSPDVEAKFLLARPRVCSKINNHVTRDGLPFLRRLAASNHAINWLVKPTVKQAQVWGGIRDMMMTCSKYALYTK